MRPRRLAGLMVPTFAAIIAAAIAFAGVAYAAVMLYKHVIEPALNPPSTQEEVVQTEKEPEAEESESETPVVDENAERNQRAHDSFESIIEEYHDAIADGYSESSMPDVNGELFQGGESTTAAWYTYVDLDDDNIDELVITLRSDESMASTVYNFNEERGVSAMAYGCYGRGLRNYYKL